MLPLKMLAIRAVIALASVLAVLALACSFEGTRSAFVRLGLSAWLATHGMHIAGGDIRVETDRLVADSLEIDDEYGRVFSMRRLDVAYDWRALVGRSDRRYGLRSVVVEQPALRIVVLPDGSTNLTSFLGGGQPAPGAAKTTAAAAVPFDCAVRVRAGRLDIENPSAYAQPGRAFGIDAIDADASARAGRATGALTARYATGASIAVIRGELSENDAVGFAQATIAVSGADIAPPLDAFLSTEAFAVNAGTVDATLQLYDAGYAGSDGPAWQFGGRGYVHGAGLRFDPLAVPIRDISGPLALQTGYLGMPALYGSVAGMPIAAQGSIRLFNGVRLALRAQAHGDLHAMRTLFSSGRDLAVSGPVSSRIRIDGGLDNIHVDGVLEAHGPVYYERAPFGAMRAVFYYHDGHVTVPGVQAQYDGGRVDARGDIDLSASTEPKLEAIALAKLPAARLPLAVNLNPGSEVRARLLVTGPLSTALYGAFAQTRGGLGAKTTINIAGSFGENAVSAAQVAWPSGDVTMRTGYDHTDPSNRAFFASIVAEHAPFRLRTGGAALPGLTGVVTLPAASATVDGAAVMHGTDSGALQTAASMNAARTRIAGEDAGDVTLRAHSIGPRVEISQVSVAGRDIRASARGTARIDPRSLAYAIALRGSAAADLSHATIMAVTATGIVSGDFEAAISTGGWAATFTTHGGSVNVAGLSIRDASVVAAAGGASPLRFGGRADVFGGSAAALGSFAFGADPRDTAPVTSVWANGIDAAAIGRTSGLPLDAGTAVLIGQFAPSASGGTFTGALSLAHGLVAKTPVDGDADFAYGNDVLHAAARVDLSGTRTQIEGDARNLAPGSLSGATIDARASVRDGDAGGVLAPFLPATIPITGSFDAALSAYGPALSPQVAATVRAGAATIRGVTFTDSAGSLSYRNRTWTVGGGRTQLGTTTIAFGGTAGPHVLEVHAQSPRMDLSDVNDFFGGTDVLAGTGHGSFAASFAPDFTSARGGVMISEAEVAGVPLGSVAATFYGLGKALHADVTQGGDLGRSRLGVDVALGPHSGALPDPRHFSYDVSGQISDLDLGLVTRLAGWENLGVVGRIDATGRAQVLPSVTMARIDFTAHDASIQKLPLETARGTLHADGAKVWISDALVEAPFGRSTGTFSLTRSGALSGDAQVSLTDLGALASFAQLPGRFTGSATGTLSLAGTMQNPKYEAQLRAGSGTALGVAYDDLSLHASYSRNAASIGDTNMHLAGGDGMLSLAGTLPLQLSPLALGPANRPLNLALTAQHVRMHAFDPLVSRFGTVDGTLDASIAASGLAGKPELAGNATVRDGMFSSKFQSVPLRDINAALTLSHDSVTLSKLTGAVGDGSFSGSGAATVVPAVGLAYYVTFNAHAVPLAVPDWISGTLDNDLSLTKSGNTPYLAGTASLRNGTIPFSAIYALATTLGQTSGPVQTTNVPGVPALRPGHTIAYGGAIYPPGQHLLTEANLATPPPTIFDLPALNLGLATKLDDMRVRGGPVDITAGGTLDVNGSVRDPQLDGVFNSKRGQISALGLSFRVTRGQLTFDPESGVLPSLDATAVMDIQGDRITLAMSGRIDRLSTELSSSQGKSSGQILSTLVTGSDIGALSGGVSQQTLTSGAASYLSSQLTSSLLDPFSNALAQSLNIEQVALRLAANGDVIVDVRKYVTPTVAVLYTSTLTAPVTQSYGVAYNLREYAALELGSTIAPSGFSSFLLNMRFTFK